MIREEIKKLLQSNKNENINYQNLWDTEKGALRWKFMVINAYFRIISNK
jgi:hypothetical protein